VLLRKSTGFSFGLPDGHRYTPEALVLALMGALVGHQCPALPGKTQAAIVAGGQGRGFVPEFAAWSLWVKRQPEEAMKRKMVAGSVGMRWQNRTAVFNPAYYCADLGQALSLAAQRRRT